jgi:hypothetical protein
MWLKGGLICCRFSQGFRLSPSLIFSAKRAHRILKPGILRGMNITVSNGLPPRLGMNQHEGLLRHAAPCSFYHVHPANHDRIPCFISGYRVCLLDGQEGNGVLLLRPEGDQIKLQLTEAASGVSSSRPCFVPIDSMHRGVTTEPFGCAAPHLIRVKILGVVDEDGTLKTEGRSGEGFPRPGHEAFLFPQGVRHFTTEKGGCVTPDVGVRLSGLCGGRITTLEPRMNPGGEVRGVPILCHRSGEPTATAWV